MEMQYNYKNIYYTYVMDEVWNKALDSYIDKEIKEEVKKVKEWDD